MVLFSNGQNDPSSSSGNSSGSGSDSEEKRFYKKNINSQRRRSSSTSASEFESESEQVRSLPAADIPAVPPSPKENPETQPAFKKKPSAADSSSIRNQGTSSEPNPKPPSASKTKRVLAGKRSKDDDSNEEQPERKNKSASKGKELAEEEATPSNPRKKKQRKQRQESPAVFAQATPSAKDSPQKSSKKTAHVWTDEDETVIMHGYLVCVKEGLEFPKNIPQLIEKIKDSVPHEMSKTQVYEKLRRMKGRYESIKDNMDKGNIKEGVFSYRTSHEKELYQLWKRAWGGQPEGDAMEVERVGGALEEVDGTEVVGGDRSSAGKEHITAADHGEEDEEEEEEVEGEAGADIAKVLEALKTPKAFVSNQIPDNVLVKLTPVSNGKPEERLGYETFMKETRDKLFEFIGDVKKMTENSEAETRALLDSCLGSKNRTHGAGRRANSVAWLRNWEPDLEDVYSIREIPGVDEARVQAMEEKWRKQQIRELELRSRRFALFQEQCSMQIEALKETSGNARTQ